MPLDIPLPTEAPEDDPDQYVPLLLSAIEGFLLAQDVWEPSDYPLARQYMNDLMSYIVDLFAGVIVRLPIGWMSEYPSSTVPAKFLLCDGQAVSRSTYAALFDVIGTVFGSGDGSTTFNVPDMRARSPMGVDGSLIPALGSEQGAAAVSLSISNLPTHDHDYADPGHSHRVPKQSGTVNAAVNTVSFATRTEGLTSPLIMSSTEPTGITFHAQGSNAPHANLHPVLGLNFMIYAGV